MYIGNNTSFIFHFVIIFKKEGWKSMLQGWHTHQIICGHYTLCVFAAVFWGEMNACLLVKIITHSEQKLRINSFGSYIPNGGFSWQFRDWLNHWFLPVQLYYNFFCVAIQMKVHFLLWSSYRVAYSYGNGFQVSVILIGLFTI